MQYRELGRSDLTISEIALGSWLTYGGGVARAQAESCLARALDAGVDPIDTANDHAGGDAAGRLARRQHRPEPGADRGGAPPVESRR